MSGVPSTTFQGVEIVYERASNLWVAHIESERIVAASLDDMEKRIDRINNPKMKGGKAFERVAAFYRPYSDGKVAECTITSIVRSSRRNSFEAWISIPSSAGRPERTRVGSGLFLKDKDNIALYEQSKKLFEEAERLSGEARKLTRQLKPLKLDEFAKDVED